MIKNDLLADINFRNKDFKLPYPFQDFSLQQIIQLANRILICEANNGHTSNIFLNGELVEDEHDSVYISLLLYIKFLAQQIEKYFINLSQMKMMGYEYPDVYSYITKLINNIDKCIDTNIKKGKRPFPIDIIKYLGQDIEKIEEYNYELYKIIDLLLKQKGVKIKGGFERYKEIEITDKDTTDLSDISIKLLKILEVSDEEVELRYQKSNETFEIKKINLQFWLSKNIDNDKKLVLANLKK